MIPAKLQADIHTLSRQEKYHLIQVLVRDLELEETPRQTRVLQRPEIKRSDQQEASKTQAIDTLLRKWKGSLKGVDADAAKQRYLQEKYH